MWHHVPLLLFGKNTLACIAPTGLVPASQEPSAGASWLLHCGLGPHEPKALLLFHLLSSVCCRNWKCCRGSRTLLPTLTHSSWRWLNLHSMCAIVTERMYSWGNCFAVMFCGTYIHQEITTAKPWLPSKTLSQTFVDWLVIVVAIKYQTRPSKTWQLWPRSFYLWRQTSCNFQFLNQRANFPGNYCSAVCIPLQQLAWATSLCHGITVIEVSLHCWCVDDWQSAVTVFFFS